jgi:hypothetical protein
MTRRPITSMRAERGSRIGSSAAYEQIMKIPRGFDRTFTPGTSGPVRDYTACKPVRDHRFGPCTIDGVVPLLFAPGPNATRLKDLGRLTSGDVSVVAPLRSDAARRCTRRAPDGSLPATRLRRLRPAVRRCRKRLRALYAR